MRVISIKYLVIILFLISGNISQASTPGKVVKAGRVVRVISGDSIEFSTILGSTYQVHIAGIDAPESGQPYAEESRKFLENLIQGKPITEESGNIFYEGASIAEIVLEQGCAWYQKNTLKSDKLEYYTAKAQSAKAGLWAEKNPVPPWEYSRRKKIVLVDDRYYRAAQSSAVHTSEKSNIQEISSSAGETKNMLDRSQVIHVTPTHLFVVTDQNGVNTTKSIALETLPEEIRKKYNYSPEKAAEYRAEREKLNKSAARRHAKQSEALTAAEKERKAAEKERQLNSWREYRAKVYKDYQYEVNADRK